MSIIRLIKETAFEKNNPGTIILKEGKGTGFSDEHAVAKVWNAASSLSAKEKKEVMQSPEHLQKWVAKAKTDKNHPLHISKHEGTEGFKGGDKSNVEGYHKELHDAAHMVHALANHDTNPKSKKTLKQAFHEGVKARVTGAVKPKLHPNWEKNGGSDKTSKADLQISNGDDHHHTISLKKGDSQLMSAQSGEFRATMHHAIDQYTKDEKTRAHLKGEIEKITKHQKAHRKAKSEDERSRLVSHAQKILDSIHESHPNLLHHVAHEASTGHGKFGHGAEGTAQYLASFTDKGQAHIHNTETAKEPIAVSGYRCAKGKGTNSDGTPREGTVRMDFKAIKEKVS